MTLDGLRAVEHEAYGEDILAVERRRIGSVVLKAVPTFEIVCC